MAQAVQEMFPGVNLGIGPFITDGFYYDFGAIDAVTPEMLREIEKRMKRIVKEGQRFVRRDITEDRGVRSWPTSPTSSSSSPPRERAPRAPRSRSAPAG